MKKKQDRDVWTPVFAAFSCGIFCAMFCGCVFKLDDIKTLQEARHIYTAMAVSAFGALFFVLFTLLQVTALEASDE